MSQLQVNTPSFILYLRDKVQHFTAGCITDKLSTWSALTSDAEILSAVSGLPLEFESIPIQQFYLHSQKFTPEESLFIGNKPFNPENVIKESLHEPGEFIFAAKIRWILSTL